MAATSVLTDPTGPSIYGPLIDSPEKKRPDEKSPASETASPDVVKRVKAAMAAAKGGGAEAKEPSSQQSPTKDGMPQWPGFKEYDPPPKQENTSPLEAWGSLAMLAAALGGALSRNHMTTALNAAGEALKGLHQGDTERFKNKMEEWKTGAENASRVQNYEIETYKAIMDRKDKDWLHQLEAQTHALQNDNLRSLIQSRDAHAVERRIKDMDKTQKAVSAQKQEQDNKLIAEGIESGRQPPTTTGLYKQGPGVKAQLERDGFDQSKAILEYDAAKRQVSSLNSTQMVRLNGLATSVVNTIDEAKSLAMQMHLSGVPALNYVELQAYVQTAGNSKDGQLVSRYLAAVNTVKEEYAQIANGGYAPIEAAWRLAEQQVNPIYGAEELTASLDEIQRLINYRIHALTEGNFGSINSPNRYAGTTGSTKPDSSQGGGDSSALDKAAVDKALDKARAAIADGKPRSQVIQRLKEHGIVDTEGL